MDIREMRTRLGDTQSEFAARYGVARGLLAMGFYREVEKMMYFYKMYFDRYGKVCNAQSVGYHGVFHVHENDHVEITGYLAILPFSVYDVNKSEQFMQDMLPMIRWCIECQIGEMRDGMLPFNGDETYMAGGFLPRFAMYDGSAEATMLLARSIELYSIYTGDTQYDGVLTEIKETYLTNFVRNGRLMANIPERTPLRDYPAMRHGVCEDCGEVMADLTRNVNYRYVCDRCLATHEPIPPRAFGSIELASSKLAPLYVGSKLVPDSMMRVYLEEMVDAFHKSGQMPSGCPDGHAVGYDYGLFLYALVKTEHPAAKEICDLTVSILDETGVWCEYYQNGIPWKTRCRPWESAINIEGIIAFVEKKKEVLTPAEAVIVSRIPVLRDPCILKADGRYYAYGTGWAGYRSVSRRLDGRWEELGTVVESPADYDGDPWAPEVYEYGGAYYMFTTYRSRETGRRGCAVFRSDKPEGPFRLYSDGHVTPKEWNAIDGSLYVDKDGQPWMVFVHEWVSTDDKVGRMACAKMAKDLSGFISEPEELFRADDAPWAVRGVTDGCWVYRCQDDSLIMIWSNWDKDGYCVGMAKSPSGEVIGPWEQQEDRLFTKSILGDYDGGHGMIFTDYDGRLWLSLHSPNDADDGRPETPLFVPLKEENGRLTWDLTERRNEKQKG